MSDGRTYWDAEAEAKAKSENLYVLKQPLAIEPEKVFNGQVYELPFRQWGMKNNHSCISQETLDEHFAPLDVGALTTQLEKILDKLTDKNGWDDVGQELRDVALAEVLRVCGLTQESE